MTRKELEEARNRGYRKYGYFNAFCFLTRSCEVCDKRVRFWCKVKRKIEHIQEKRILKIVGETE